MKKTIVWLLYFQYFMTTPDYISPNLVETRKFGGCYWAFIWPLPCKQDHSLSYVIYGVKLEGPLCKNSKGVQKKPCKQDHSLSYFIFRLKLEGQLCKYSKGVQKKCGNVCAYLWNLHEPQNPPCWSRQCWGESVSVEITGRRILLDLRNQNLAPQPGQGQSPAGRANCWRQVPGGGCGSPTPWRRWDSLPHLKN